MSSSIQQKARLQRDWSKFTNITQICSICTIFIKNYPYKRPFEREVPDSDSMLFYHHNSYTSLLFSSSTCQICELFLWLIEDELKMRDQSDLLSTLKRTASGSVLQVEKVESLDPYAGVNIKIREGAGTRRNGDGSHMRITLIFSHGIDSYYISDNDLDDNVIFAVRYASTHPTKKPKHSLWSNPSQTDFEFRLPVVKKWISDCSANRHKDCLPDAEALLPKRTLWVRNPLLAKDYVQVVETDSRKGHYATLSYCWGAAVPFTTTKATLAHRLDRIAIADLPRTIRDAVLAARCLDIDYLWVDSLTIIQDDKDDWAREAAKMSSYYTNAAITFVAEVGLDSESGLFNDLVPSFLGHLDKWDFAIRIPSIHHVFQSPIIHERGWTMQEIHLSRRLLIFGGDQMHWVCTTSISHEFKTDILPARSRLTKPIIYSKPRNSEQKFGLYQDWSTILYEYSKRKFTYPSDRLPALAGISEHFCMLLGDEPVLGLWRAEFITFLLWRPIAHVAGARIPSMPSWSPLAWSGEINYDDSSTDHFYFACSDVLSDLAEVVTASISWSSAPLTSTPSATLVIKSRAIDAPFKTYPSQDFHGSGVREARLHGDPTEECDGLLRMVLYIHDIDDDYTGNVTFLEMASAESEYADDDAIYYKLLILVQKGAVGTYSRIGCGIARKSESDLEDIFHGAEQRVVNLV